MFSYDVSHFCRIFFSIIYKGWDMNSLPWIIIKMPLLCALCYFRLDLSNEKHIWVTILLTFKCLIAPSHHICFIYIITFLIIHYNYALYIKKSTSEVATLQESVLPTLRLNQGIGLLLIPVLRTKNVMPRFAEPITVNVISTGFPGNWATWDPL